ncbi:MAG TPA: EAL domain-containing protein [Rhodospirillaceae bacterium]|nr:EAL domain-containing protein [Rhodospirillaceae bacterium]
MSARLAETEAALTALRTGAADAFVGMAGEVFYLGGSEQPYVTFFSAMNEGGVTLDSGGVVLHCNPRFTAMVGRPIEDLRCGTFLSCVADQDRPRVVELLESDETTAGEALLVTPSGTLPSRISLRTVDTGPLRFRCMVVTDLSERVRAEAELRIAAIAFESQEGMVVTDPQGVIIRVNRAFTKLTGYGDKEAIGRTPAMLSSGRHDEEFYRRMWAALKTKKYWQGEIWNRRKDGKIYAEWLTISAVCTPEGEVTHFVGAFSEITKNKEAEAEIHRLAYYDALTGLPNRRLLHDRIGQALAGSHRHGRYGALLFLDLDNFKILNDTLGHDAGDKMLVEATERIKANLRTGDTVARLGGDEFVLMLEDLSAEAHEAAVQTRQVGEKIREALAQPYGLGGRDFHCSASFGAVLFRGHEEVVETLLKCADLAMYEAKNAGRNTLRFFDPSMQVALEERSALEADLRSALEGRQLHLHYQPQVDGRGRVIGAEALLRWAHPERGMVLPGEIIPLAEETGLILPIGQWVLETACAQIAAWSENQDTCELKLAINVSARQFRQADFVARIRGALEKSGAAPSRLKIELTESLVIDNLAETITRMKELKALGVLFSMDDFGTGFSSLSSLKRLPLDQLKIDRAFVLDLATDLSDAAIVQTIVTMGKTLGLDVIAEGVETEAQLERLVALGCDSYQGFLFARPMALAAFEAFLGRQIPKTLTH